MKAAILVVCSMIAASLAIPFADNKLNKKKSTLAEIEEKLSEVEAVLEAMKNNTIPTAARDDQNLITNNTSSQSMEEMLLHTANTQEAIAEIESLGGWVTLLLGNDLIVARVSRELIDKKTTFTSSSAHISSSASPETLMFAHAFYKAREDMKKPQPAPECWTDRTPPLALVRESPFPSGADSPYRKTMTGTIAFGCIIVSGPGSLAISDDERDKIVSEIVAGLRFWVNTAPASANLRFYYYYGRITITAAQPSYCAPNNYASCHDVFANAALQKLGYPTGQSGRDQLAQYLKADCGADGAYLGFFSKYRQNYFSYAYIGGGPLYMQYSNDGWGPDKIDRVFAHETGHVFNAPDEYTNCDCDKNYGEGSCTDWNSNCKWCTSSQVSCIMKNAEFQVCSHTRKHLGWC